MRWPLPLLAVTIAGCAAPAKMRFGDLWAASRPAGEANEPGEPGNPPEAPAADPAPAETATGRAAGPPLDATLLRFGLEARERRAAFAPSHGFPVRVAAAWEALAEQLEAYLARPMPQTPLAELVRARVTVEVELDLDRERFGAPPPALAAQLSDRLERLARRALAARALGQSLFAASAPPALRWPITGGELSSAFGVRVHPIDGAPRMHWGIDLAAAPGHVVTAAAPGYVIHAGFTYGYGLVVEVRHDGELTSRYGHLSRLLCRPGDRVDFGQPLGLVGATGRATGPHLHFEVWRGGRAEDPLVLLGATWRRSAAN